jgi:hypothetical protein
VKLKPSRSGSKRERQPKTGIAGPGKLVDPNFIKGEADEDTRAKSRPAPAPGVPVSNEQYESLKRKAKTERALPSKHSQEDPSGKK